MKERIRSRFLGKCIFEVIQFEQNVIDQIKHFDKVIDDCEGKDQIRIEQTLKQIQNVHMDRLLQKIRRMQHYKK